MLLTYTAGMAWELLKDQEAAKASLATATAVYEEAGPPIAGGRWYVLPGDEVRFLTPGGNVEVAIIPAEMLHADGFREVPQGT